MNDVKFSYVVLRNWDNLPDSVQLGEHSDLDLLVYDIEHWQEIFPEAKRVFAEPRVQFKVPIEDSFVYVDVRHVGDGYYPEKFEKDILNNRELHPKGFYIPCAIHYCLGLVYHAVHHKNSNNYPEILADLSVEQLLDSLKGSSIGWSEPTDYSVGRFNAYFKGATSIVERSEGTVIKEQVGYKDRDLMANEARILKEINSVHFPIMFNHLNNQIEMEDCGEELTLDNLPENWKEQLGQIIKDLRKYQIEHRDIQPNNLMVRGGVIKLIDFGWARFVDDPPDYPPECLGFPYRSPWGADDNFAMRKVIREFEYKKEEALCEY